MADRPRIVRAADHEAMPDGTLYAALLPDRMDLGTGAFQDGGAGAGIVSVPVGAMTWAHNHNEVELFAILSGNALLDWDGGRETLAPGDAVVMPPLVRHAFCSASASAPLTLFHCYLPDAGLADAQARRRAAELMQPRAPALVLAAVGASDCVAAQSLAEVAQRWLAQRGARAQSVPWPRGTTETARPLLARLKALACLVDTKGGPALDLERHRVLLVRTIDRTAMTANLRRHHARQLAGTLPRLPVADLRDVLAAIAACEETGQLDRAQLLSFFPLGKAEACGMAMPVLLQLLGWPVPAVMHATDVLQGHAQEAPGAGRRASWSQWLADLLDRVERQHGALVPQAGRWSAAQLGAWDDLRMLALAAERALAPADLDVRRCLELLDAMVMRARGLYEPDVAAHVCESFEAERRTSLAIELAAAARLADLLAPLAPQAGEALSRALGIGRAAGQSDAGALRLVQAGTRVAPELLQGFWARATAQGPARV